MCNNEMKDENSDSKGISKVRRKPESLDIVMGKNAKASDNGSDLMKNVSDEKVFQSKVLELPSTLVPQNNIDDDDEEEEMEEEEEEEENSQECPDTHINDDSCALYDEGFQEGNEGLYLQAEGEKGRLATDRRRELGKYEFRLLGNQIVKGKGGRKTYKCDICGGMYKHGFSLKRHYLRMHINYQYLSESDISNCNISTQQSSTKKSAVQKGTVQSDSTNTTSNIKISSLTHIQTSYAMPGLYKCHLCLQLFDELHNLKFHVTNHPNQPNSKRFPCTQCNMTFSHRQNLVRHLSVHSGAKPYACRHCGKGFPTATNQKRHERIHEGVKPYQCDHCSSLFTQSGDLKKHIRKQHNKFFHPCAFCVKYFPTAEVLEEHVISHGETLDSNSRLLKKKNFPNASNLNYRSAMMKKKAIKPSSFKSAKLQRRYVCNICHKRFSSQINLSQHRRSVHSTRYTRSKNTKKAAPPKSSDNFNDDIILREPPTTEADFYADIAYNISDNLLNYLDGKLENHKVSLPLQNQTDLKCTDENYTPAALNKELPWKFYNFPSSFDIADGENKSKDCDSSDLIPFNLTKPKSSQNMPRILTETFSLTHAEMMNCLSLSSVNNSPAEMHYVDGVLDLSVPNKCKKPILCEPEEKAVNCEVSNSKLFLCYVCGESVLTLEDIENHKINNHPNVQCSHLEIDGLKDMPLEMFKQTCSSIGLLKTCVVPPLTISTEKLACTKCQLDFPSASELHMHMLECGGYENETQFSGIKQSKGFGSRKKYVTRGMKRNVQQCGEKKNGWNSNGKAKKEIAESFISESTELVQSKDQESLICGGCEKSFHNLTALERHKKCCHQRLIQKKKDRNKDIRQQHSCPYCARSFTYLASLKKHVSDCILQADKNNKKMKLNKFLSCRTAKKRMASLGSSPNAVQSDSLQSASNTPSSKENMKSTEDASKNEVAEQKQSLTIHIKGEIDDKTEDTDDEILRILDETQEFECVKEEVGVLTRLKEEDKQEPHTTYACPHCKRTYTYMANFKKHVKDACPLRKDSAKTEDFNTAKSDEENYAEDALPNLKMEFEEKQTVPEEEYDEEMPDSNEISERIEKNDEVENVNPKETDGQKSRIQPMDCRICHRIFFDYVKLLQHQLSHKLNSSDGIQIPSDGDKKTECRFCQASFSNLKELREHYRTCDTKSNSSPKMLPKMNTLKHKGGWPKGKSRKGYIPKHKRNNIDDDGENNDSKKKVTPLFVNRDTTSKVSRVKGKLKKFNKKMPAKAKTKKRKRTTATSLASETSLPNNFTEDVNNVSHSLVHREQLTVYRSSILRRMKRSTKHKPKKTPLLSTKIGTTESVLVSS